MAWLVITDDCPRDLAVGGVQFGGRLLPGLFRGGVTRAMARDHGLAGGHG
jgi:hypothetical protein